MIVRSLRNKLFRAGVRLGQRLPGHLDRVFATMIANRIACDCRVIAEAKEPDAPTVLVFSAFRFREDLDVLAKSGALRLIAAPPEALQSVNAMFRTVPDIDQFDKYQYFLEQDPDLLHERERLTDFCALVLAALHRELPFDCAITPAVHYRYEHPWAAACDGLEIPFIALHKEFTVLDRRHLPIRIERYRAQGRRFCGTEVLVINETARALFADCGIADSEHIEVVGMPRMDRLFDPESPLRHKSHAGTQVTLFSFAHYSGDLDPGERRSKLFSARDHEGFVRLFRDVHVAIAELAVKHPEVTFKIKPKNVVGWWIVEIERVVREALGKGLDEIPNCAVVDERAPELIRDSDVVIGFNSTVLLESLALERPTIVPLFDEAVDTYPDNVYLKDCLDVFYCATSKGDLMAAVERGIAGQELEPPASPARIEEVFRTYLGFSDAGSAQRVVAAINRCVAGAAGTPETRPADQKTIDRERAA